MGGAVDLSVVEAWTGSEVVADTRDLSRGEWLELRRTGLGGSDAAAVCGLSKWATPVGVWLDKTGAAAEVDASGPVADTGSEAMWWGQTLEPVVRDAVAGRLGVRIDAAPFMLRSCSLPFACVNLDGLAWLPSSLGPAVYEGKIASEWVRHDWADDEVPVAYVLQCQHALMVTGLDAVVVGVLIGGNRLEVRELERDDELIGQLAAIESEFWELVTSGTMPRADGSKACTDLLSDLYDARPGLVRTVDEVDPAVALGPGTTLAAAEAVAVLLDERRLADDDEKAAKARKADASNRLRAVLGDATELVDGNGSTLATWRPQTKVGLEVGVDEAAVRHAHPTLARYLERSTTTRVLRVNKPKKGTA